MFSMKIIYVAAGRYILLLRDVQTIWFTVGFFTRRIQPNCDSLPSPSPGEIHWISWCFSGPGVAESVLKISRRGCQSRLLAGGAWRGPGCLPDCPGRTINSSVRHNILQSKPIPPSGRTRLWLWHPVNRAWNQISLGGAGGSVNF